MGFFSRKKKTKSPLLAPAHFSIYNIRCGRSSWMVKGPSIDVAMATWLTNLPEGTRLDEHIFCLRVGDHDSMDWVWKTKAVLDFYKYELSKR